MFNRFKNTGLIILIISLFAVVDAYGQVNCPTCPKGMTAPASISTPLQGFHGYTSEVKIFDGTVPTCYTPTANTLNGHLRGINNSLCNLRLRIDTLRNRDTLFICRLDSLINAVETVEGNLASTYNTSIISSDSSVNIISGIVGSTLQFNLSVDIDSIKKKIIRGWDYSCLGVPQDFDSIINKLIEISCGVESPASDDCDNTWSLYATNTIGSTASSTTVSITPNSVGVIPSGNCVIKIEYIYTLLDSSGNSLINGVVNGGNALNVATNFTIPIGYIQGARTIRIITRFWKEKCVSYKYCGVQDTLKTTTVPVFVLSALVFNEDNYGASVGVLQSFSVGSNDVIPYTIATATLVRGASRGTASLTGTSLTYTATTVGVDSLRYQITDIYGQTDTAYIIITNTTPTADEFGITGSIELCVQSGTTVRIFNSLSISNNIGAVKLYSMTYTNDTGLAVILLNPLLPTFSSLQTAFNGADYILSNSYRFSNLAIARLNTYGGLITITLMVRNNLGVDKLLDIVIDIPVALSDDYTCPTVLDAAYITNEYDLP